MDSHGNSVAYSARAAHPNQPLPDGYSKKGASYRRPIDSQPTPAQSSSHQPSPNAPSSSSRSASHRRRLSQHIPPPTTGPSVEPLPAAPDVPRGPPPTSYRDPYAPKGSSRTPSRSHSGRSRDPTIQMIAGRQQPNITIPAERLQHLRSPPYMPVEPLSGPVDGLVRRDSGRRPSVPDRSPLQKLEGKLDDISKEEKRARMLELELAAQEKAEAEMRARRAREAAAVAAAKQRIVSGPAPAEHAPSRATNNKRHVSMPVRKPQPPPEDTLSDSDHGHMYDLSEPWDPTRTRTPTGPHRIPSQSKKYASLQRPDHALHHADATAGHSQNFKAKEPAGVARGTGSFRDRSNTTDQPQQKGERKPVPAGLGLYEVEVPPNASRQIGSNVARYDSRKLSKDLPPVPRDHASNERRRDSRGIFAAQQEMEQQKVGQTNGQTVASHLHVPGNRRSVGFTEDTADGHQEYIRDPEQHVTDLFSPHHDPDRQYVPPPMLEEWRNATVAPLVEEDLNLDTAPRRSNSVSKTWWEESTGTRQRRMSGGYIEPTYDGYADPPATQTTFNPPLYLKCGPLLRYTGLRKDKGKTGKDREIWRGSVMIVTSDEQSSYQKPPTLRLFKQPMDLLPPPPAEVGDDDLHPAYIDPLEGQAKVSRTGRTLYAKAIDDIPENEDISRIEDNTGLFSDEIPSGERSSRIRKKDGEKLGKVREIPGVRLHAERGVTFWRFNLEVELGASQERVAYRINRGPAIGFWVPAKGETMNIMFHSCNGFSWSVNPDEFCGPDPMWRDVLNNHQTQPFHVMLGGGDQIYMDAAMHETTLFKQWTDHRNPLHKHHTPFSEELQNELEQFYLDRYCMWFSQGLFGMANSQIPMVNIWDDHDLIDGYGSYPHHFNQTPVFMGLGAVAFKYYMLFQHQSVVTETESTEPSWVLGAHPGPYIKERSRSVFMHLGRKVAFLGMDCRTERRRNEILSEDSYDIIFDRLEEEIIKGETKHLVVLLGVPIAYPRLNFLENVLTSPLMDPIKALGRAGMLGNFVNKFDGGVEILDDLDDHWTARGHKMERGLLIKELQHIAKTKSVRITILGGDVHLAAVGQFFSNKKLGIPKDKDHRYMPNIISSAIVNTPPPDIMADVINKRNKIHHLDDETDEDMIPLFQVDVDQKKRNNVHLLPRRNWCSLREWKPGTTPPGSPSLGPETPKLSRTLSDYTPGKLVRRLSQSGGGSRRGRGPPLSYYNNPANAAADEHQTVPQSSFSPERPEKPRSRRSSLTSLFRRRASVDDVDAPSSSHSLPPPRRPSSPERPSNFHRRPSILGKRGLSEYINLQGGLDVCLNLEQSQHDPAGITSPYRLIIPALDCVAPEEGEEMPEKERRKSMLEGVFGVFKGGSRRRTVGDDGYSHTSESASDSGSEEELDEEERARKRYTVGPRILLPGFASRKRASQSQPQPSPGFADPESPPARGYMSAPPVNRRQSVDSHPPHIHAQPPQHRHSTWEGAAAKRHVSAPVPNYDSPQAPVTTLPSRSNSNRQPNYNSSHQSQLPAPTREAQEPDTKVHRRSMGGILNQHHDERFEHEAHVATHTPAAARSKRDSYPPHPAIVGAGPGSPYTKGNMKARDDVGGDGYFGSGGRNGSQSQSAGVGARYLGHGKYADSDEDSVGSYSDDVDGERSQDTFIPPPKKKKWQVWKDY